MDFFVSQSSIQKPFNPQFSQWYFSSFQELRLIFVKSCEIVQYWDTSIPRLKYNLGSFPGIITKFKAFFNYQYKKLNFEDFILGLVEQKRELSPRNSNNAALDPSFIYFENQNILRDTVVQQPTNYEYNSTENGPFSSLLSFEETVSPQVFKRQVENDTIIITVHRLIEADFGIRFLYIVVNDIIMFATKINDAGLPEKNYFELIMSERVTSIVFRLRDEKGVDETKQGRSVNIDNYEGCVELKRFRIDVIEKIKVPMRSSLLDGEIDNMNQVDLEISVLLSYIKRINLQDFEIKVTPEQEFMHTENYFGVKKRWMLPNFSEQNSLVTIENFEKIKEDYFKAFPQSEYCFSTFDKYIEDDFELIPLCKSMIQSIFFADASISDKLNYLWETLVFFEKLKEEYYISNECIESDTIQYFARVLCSSTYISMPEHAADNTVDYIFYGRIPSIRRALYISPIVSRYQTENLRYNGPASFDSQHDTLLNRPTRNKLYEEGDISEDHTADSKGVR